MAYADQKMSGSRVVAIVIVALIHAVIGYAFITGLAYKYVKQVQEDLKTFDINEPPPPPEEVPPPPPEDTAPPPPTVVVAPPPLVRSPVVSPPIFTQPKAPPPTLAPPAPPAPVPAPPAPPRIAKPLSPRGSPQGWVTDADYPPAAARAQEAGVVGFRLDVGPDGKVTNCTVTSSSGSSLLDSTACRLLQRRARFSAAEDSAGNKIPAAYSSRFRWVLPDR